MQYFRTFLSFLKIYPLICQRYLLVHAAGSRTSTIPSPLWQQTTTGTTNDDASGASHGSLGSFWITRPWKQFQPTPPTISLGLGEVIFGPGTALTGFNDTEPCAGKKCPKTKKLKKESGTDPSTASSIQADATEVTFPANTDILDQTTVISESPEIFSKVTKNSRPKTSPSDTTPTTLVAESIAEIFTSSAGTLDGVPLSEGSGSVIEKDETRDKLARSLDSGSDDNSLSDFSGTEKCKGKKCADEKAETTGAITATTVTSTDSSTVITVTSAQPSTTVSTSTIPSTSAQTTTVLRSSSKKPRRKTTLSSSSSATMQRTIGHPPKVDHLKTTTTATLTATSVVPISSAVTKTVTTSVPENFFASVDEKVLHRQENLAHFLLVKKTSDDDRFWITFREVLGSEGNPAVLVDIEDFLDQLKILLSFGKITLAEVKLALDQLLGVLSAEDPVIRSLQKFIAVRQQRAITDECNKKVVGYYTSFGAKEITEEIMSYFTHIIYAFADMGNDSTLSISANSTIRLQKLLDLRGNDSFPKIMIAVGGWNSADKFKPIVREKKALQRFSVKLGNIIKTFGLDGVDIDWEYPGETPDDKSLYVKFMHQMRKRLNFWRRGLKKDHLYLTFAGPAGYENLRKGYDLKGLLDGNTVDWVNVMAYDYYGPWESEFGLDTGPPAPLFFGAPRNYSRKLNVQWTTEKYMCDIKQPDKIMLGVPLYGRYWENVGAAMDSSGMWRHADGDKAKGGQVSFNEVDNGYLKNGSKPAFNDLAKASFAYNSETRVYLGYESVQSIDFKAQYLLQNKLGGVMMWAIDYDDENLTLIRALTSGNLCGPRNITIKESNYTCYEQRWWSTDQPDKLGMCGPMAPLVDGYYAVCDPNDEAYSCCGKWGYCGVGKDYCDCPDCVNYAKTPEKIKTKSVQPTTGTVQWFTLDYPAETRGKCGYTAPLLNGSIPICNPDDWNGYCCSNEGICGNDPQSCDCLGCVNFKKNPNYRYPPKAVFKMKKQWWTWDDGTQNTGKCGPKAPLLNGHEPICDPNNEAAHCCSPFGFCGGTRDYCECNGCVDYRNLFLSLNKTIR